MENYIGVMFPTLAEANAGKAALLDLSRQGSVQVERVGIFARGQNGKLVREDSDNGPRGGTDEEAAAAMERVLTHGMYALLARVTGEQSGIHQRCNGRQRRHRLSPFYRPDRIVGPAPPYRRVKPRVAEPSRTKPRALEGVDGTHRSDASVRQPLGRPPATSRIRGAATTPRRSFGPALR